MKLNTFVLTVVIMTLPASAAIDIEQVAITAGPEALFSGGLDYFIELDVRGSGIDGLSLTLPDGVTTLPVPQFGPGIWVLSDSGYSSLFGVRSAIGSGQFVLEIDGTAGDTDTLDFQFDPGTTDPFGGFLDPIRPIDFELVSPGPAFRWSCLGVCGDASFVTLDDRLGNEAFFDNPSIEFWQPGSFQPGTRTFGLSTFETYAGPEQRVSSGGDPYDFFSGYESFREVEFTAVAAPVLSMTRGPGSTEVTLSWSGTSGSDQVYRGTDALTVLESPLLSSSSATAVDDPSGLGDLAYYRVMD